MNKNIDIETMENVEIIEALSNKEVAATISDLKENLDKHELLAVFELLLENMTVKEKRSALTSATNIYNHAFIQSLLLNGIIED